MWWRLVYDVSAWYGSSGIRFSCCARENSPNISWRGPPRVRSGHVFKGSDYLNGRRYFHVRLYADTVENYVLLSALLRIFVGLKRSRSDVVSLD